MDEWETNSTSHQMNMPKWSSPTDPKIIPSLGFPPIFETSPKAKPWNVWNLFISAALRVQHGRNQVSSPHCQLPQLFMDQKHFGDTGASWRIRRQGIRRTVQNQGGVTMTSLLRPVVSSQGPKKVIPDRIGNGKNMLKPPSNRWFPSLWDEKC